MPAELDMLPESWKYGPRLTSGVSSSLRRRVEEVQARRTINEAVLDMARDYLERERWALHSDLDRDVWRLYAEGATVREIAEALQYAKSHIARILLKHRSRAGIP